jgi:4-amino-4-deoxy-L-arabinose transferase-like glycosyltransferase
MAGPLRMSSTHVVFALALVLRLVWVLVSGGTALQTSDDARAYDDLALKLVERHEFVTVIDPPHRLDLPYAQRPPLTPVVLAGIYLVVGPHLLAAQIVFAIIGAVTAALVLLLGRRLFSERIGVVAGLLVALYPFFIFLAAVPLTENLAIPLYVLLALALCGDGAGSSVKNAIITGLVLGLAALNRPQILGFFPLVILIACLDDRGWAAGTRWVTAVLICSTLVMAPWVIRNRIVLGKWVPVSTQGGWALYEGNNRYTQTALSKLWNGARGWYDDPQAGSGLTGPTAADVDRQAFHLATAFIGEHPSRALWFSVQKVGLFFSAYAHPVAEMSWYPLLGLSLLGLFMTAAKWLTLLPVYLLTLQTILTAAVFTSMPRFRAPVEPFFIILAAFAVCHLWGWLAVLKQRATGG